MDTLSAKDRSHRMALIRSKNTQPELIVRRLLYRLGFRFRLHRRDLPGVPDIVLVSRKKAIFVHGCFWHAHTNCTIANRPKSRRLFWDEKFSRNKARDLANENRLRDAGWDVLTVWECETKKLEVLKRKVLKTLAPIPSAKH